MNRDVLAHLGWLNAPTTTPFGSRARLARFAAADLNGGTVADPALVRIVTRNGPSHVYLVAAIQRQAMLEQAGVASLGEGVDIQSLSIEDGEGLIEVKQQRPWDLACCASRYRGEAYRLAGDHLERVRPSPDNENTRGI